MDVLNVIGEIIYKLCIREGYVYIVGNGGSSATASHFTNDLIKGCSVYGRRGIKSVCLTDSSSVITCLSNDYSYEEAIMIYLKTMGKRGDCLTVFSGSGNSVNLINAAKFARSAGITVVGFLGGNGGQLRQYCDYYIIAPSDNMEEIENIHLSYVHSIKRLLIEKLKESFGIEVVNYPSRNTFKYAIFDFDGTISLIRQGWQDVMVPYFVEVVLSTPKGKNIDKNLIVDTVKEFVDRLTGKKTIFQCIELDELVEKYGGEHQDPLIYKQEYLKRLMQKIKFRRDALANNVCDKDEYMVHGIASFLQVLENHGIKLYCASGTDEEDVRYEAKLLGIDSFFDENIYGARDDQGLDDTKEIVIRNIIKTNNLSGEELIVFGDGMIEIELCKGVGGYAVGVASDEVKRNTIDEWKRERLLRSGADAIIPNFDDTNNSLADLLLGDRDYAV